MKRPQRRLDHAARCYELLEFLSRHQMPVVCSAPDDIHGILALRSAALVEALTEPAVLLRTGARKIERAVVTSITAQGRAACLALARRTATPAGLRQS